jgi:hypothetical protein
VILLIFGGFGGGPRTDSVRGLIKHVSGARLTPTINALSDDTVPFQSHTYPHCLGNEFCKNDSGPASSSYCGCIGSQA